MEIPGHLENGIVVPHGDISVPDGTEVTIIVGGELRANSQSMSPQQHERYAAALARIDGIENENPGDAFSGDDHDRVLYGP